MFGSLNYSSDAITTRVRFYGEFLDKTNDSAADESVRKLKILTTAKEFIALCKSLAIDEDSEEDQLIEDGRLSELQRREEDKLQMLQK